MKSVIVKTHTADKTIGEIRVLTKDGQPTIIKADRNVNYEFFEEGIQAAPNHIITKRVDKDLHISFEREGAEVDLIIEDFYEYEHNALIGISENSSYYYYIPDTGEVEDYVTKLQTGDVEGQALGGENVIAPLWLPLPSGFAFPWWVLIPIVPFLFRDKDKGTPTPEAPPAVTAKTEITQSDKPLKPTTPDNPNQPKPEIVPKGQLEAAAIHTVVLQGDKTQGDKTLGDKVVAQLQGETKTPGATITEIEITPKGGDKAGQPVKIAVAADGSITPVSIETDKGLLIIEAYNPETKEITYSYQALPLFHDLDKDQVIIDDFTVRITDSNGLVSDPADFRIGILDTTPAANNDHAGEVGASGTVSGSLKDNDDFGYDGAPTDQSNQNNQVNHTAYTPVDNQPSDYGSFTINADGTYTYTVNPQNPQVQNLAAGEDLVDSIVYTITDADGDTATAVLSVTIKGREAPEISVPVTPTVPENSVPATNPNVNPSNPNTPNNPKDAGNPNTSGSDKTVFEGDGPQNGDFTIITNPNNPVTTITVGGKDIPVTGGTIPPTTIVTDKGTIVVTSYDPNTGKVTYTYDPTPQTHKDPNGNPTNDPIVDSIPVTVTGSNGKTSTSSLDIAITDSLPAANDDSNSITEDAPVNTVSGSLKDNDDFGVDGAKDDKGYTPQDKAGEYGSFKINEDGSYTYTLDNSNTDVNKLNSNETLVDSIVYTITDKDGDTATAVLTITINGRTEGEPKVDVPPEPTVPGGSVPATNPNVDPSNPSTPNQPKNEGSDPNMPPADKTVFEGDGPVEGNFTITTDPNSPVDVIKVGGVEIKVPEDGSPITPTTVPTDKGTLVVTGFNPENGEVTYTYDPEPQDHTDNTPVVDSIPVEVVDKLGKTATNTVDIAITDSAPAANDDSNSITEDAPVNTVSGSLKDNDDFGVDGAKDDKGYTPQDKAGEYGSFKINEDGSYTYTLDNSNTDVNKLNSNETLVDSIVYTITDKDGDTATAVLTITINGRTEGEPKVDVPPEPTVPGGSVPATNPNVDPSNPSTPNQPKNEGSDPNMPPADKTVFEGDGPVEGNFTITTDPNSPVDVIKVGGVEIKVPEDGSPITPTTVPTDKGTLVVTGFNPENGEVTYTYDPEPQDHTDNTPVVDSIPVEVVDKLGKTATNTVDIAITDSAPAANDDSNSITEDAPVNTVSGSLKDNDDFGVDGAKDDKGYTPQDKAGEYGSFKINEDGSYTYTLDNSNTDVNKLNSNETLVDSIVYTITDKDGDTATAVLTITINGRTEGEPKVDVPPEPTVPGGSVPATNPNVDPSNPSTPNQPKNEGSDPNMPPADKTVFEGDGPVEGNFTITTDPNSPVDVIKVGGVEIKVPEDGSPITPTTVPTDKGTLVVTGFNPENGEVTYTYDPEPQDHTDNTPVVDSIPVEVVDKLGKTATNTVDIAITDSAPAANDDSNSITEDAPVNTVSGSLKDNDDFGVDGAKDDKGYTPQDKAGEYGSFKINEDGSYTYTLDNSNTDVNKLNSNETLVDSIVYTITDKDGDTATAVLTITINGRTEGEPKVDVPPEPTVPGGSVPATNPNVDPSNPSTPNQPKNEGSDPNMPPADKTVFEGDGPVEGNFTITTDPNSPVDVIKVGGVEIKVPEDGSPITPTTVPTDKGTLVVTGFNPENGEVTYTYDPEPQDHTDNTPVVDSIPVEVVDKLGKTATNTVDIAITDSAPAANDDSNSITEDAPVNTVSGSLKDNDDFGVDGAKDDKGYTPQDKAGEYGSFKINEDGSYTYTLDNSNTDVNKLNSNETLVDSIVYTITDKDGDTATAVLTITINGRTEGEPKVDVPPEPTVPGGSVPATNPNVDPSNPSTPNQPKNEGSDPNMPPADKTVFEGDGPVEGNFTITTDPNSPVDVIKVGGVEIKVPEDGSPITPTTVPTDKGTLVVTGFNPENGEVTYTYDPEPQDHTDNTPVVDSIPVEVVDKLGKTATNTVDIAITDSAPAANDDSNSITEDAPVNTVSGSLKDNDDFGVDGAKDDKGYTPQDKAGEYGSFKINEDGSYTYTLDNSNTDVNKLNSNETLVDSIVYTITDKDGDTATAVLTITINGRTEGEPKVDVPPEPTVPGGSVPATNPNVDPSNPSTPNQPKNEGSDPNMPPADKTVFEGDGPVEGNFTITTDPNSPVDVIKVGGVEIKVPEDGSPITPTTVPTDKGTLVVTGFNPENGEVTYTYDPEPQDHTDNTPVVDSIPVEVVDKLGKTATNTVDIAITDSAPAANDDSNSITEDAPVNTVSGSLKDNDDFGVDGAKDDKGYTPQDKAGEYGSFKINEDGSYTYTLDNSNTDVNKLNSNETLVDSIVYTITDKDGDTATAVLTITINGRTEGEPKVDVPPEPTVPGGSVPATNPNVDPSNPSTPNQPKNEGSDPNMPPADKTVFEGDGPVEGNFTITTDPNSPVDVIKVGGVEIKVPEDGSPITPTTVPTDKGTLVVTGFNPENGEVTYTYDPEPQDHTDNTPVVDSIPVEVVDKLGKTATNTVDIAITDSAPAANDDSNSITEDAPVNTVSGSLKDNDDFGVDGAKDDKGYTPQDKAGEYGSFKINEDGSYTYTLDNSNTDVNKLNSNETLVDSIVYTITDKDGDTATAVLTITINGRTEGEPKVDVPPEPTVPGGSVPATNPNVDPSNPSTPNQPKNEGSDPNMPPADKTVFEGDGPVEGNFTITTDPNSPVDVIKVGGVEIKVPEDGSPITPTTVPTDKGTLVVTGFNPENGEVTYTYDPEPQDHTDNTPVVDSIPVEVVDKLGKTATNTVDIAITDSAPAANDDSNSITEDAPVNTVSGSLKDNDDFGVDGAKDDKGYTPQDKAGEYGSFKINEDGSYTYTLDNSNTDVNKLNSNETLVDSIVYTITDKDGDTATAVLTITINGRTEGEPKVDVPPEPTVPGGSVPATNPNVDPSNPSTPNQPKNEGSDPNMPPADKTVFEGDGPVEGNFTITTDPNSPVDVIKVGGVEIKVPEDGSPITPTTVPTDKGTLVVTGFNPENGEVTYTYDPEPQDHTDNTPVVDSIPVEVVDKLGKTATNTVDIAITDSAPAANDDSNSITEDAPVNTVSGSLKDNDDFGVDGAKDDKGYTPQDKAGEYGSFKINEDGSYTYTLDNSNTDVNKLNSNETLVDSIVYTITDKDGDTATAILTITINGQDEPKVDVPPADTTPVNTVPATNPTFDPTSPNKPKDAGNPDASGDNKTVFEGDGPSEGKFTVTTDKDATITSITVGDKEIPVENGTISTTTVDTGKGTLVVTGFNPENGEVTYTYDPEPQDHATDEPIVDKVPVSVKDSNQNTATSEINIAITDGLPAANDDANTISEGGETVSGSLKANDDFGADGQPSPTTGYTPQDKAGEYGSFKINEDGSYTYTLDKQDPALATLGNGETLVDSIVYTITDKDGDTATAILTITINGQDEPKVDVPPADTTPVNTVPATNPTFDPTSPNKPKDAGNPDASGDNKTVFEGDGPSEGKFTVTTDKDATITSITVGDKEIPVENGTISTTTVDTGKGTLVVTGFNPENGEVTYTYDPEPQDHATDEPIVDKVPVSVKDSNQNTATSEINIAITDGLPAANDDANTISEGGETVSGSLKANDDFGADGQPSPTTGYTPQDKAGEYGSFKINEDGSYTYTLDKQDPALATLGNGETLVDSIVYTITDKDGDTATAILTITINGQDEPKVDVPPADTTPVNTVPATNPTFDPTSPNKPKDAGNPDASGDNKTVFEGDGPSEGKFTVTTDKDATITSITVGDKEIPVENGTISTTTVDTGKGTLVVTGFNPENGEVTYTYDPEPQDHATDEPIVDKVPVSVKDSNQNTATSEINIAITDGLPAANDDANTISEGGETVSGSLKANDDFGADGQPSPTTGYTPQDKAGEYGSFKINEDGSYTYTLDKQDPALATLGNGETLVDTIVYTITDKDGDTATAILTITINGQDEPKVDVPPADTTPVNTVPATNPTFDPTSPNKPKDAGNPDASGDNKTVFEGDGPSEGKFTVTTDKDATITSITVGDKEIPVENGTISTTTVDTGKGTLVVTGFNPENGEVTYTYDPEPQDHATDEPIVDKVPVSVKDSNQNTATSEINIAITDGLPAANDDANTISEGGETVSGSLKANDDFGADGQPSPTTGYTPQDKAGEYGSFKINEDGSYTYTLDKQDPALATLGNGETLVDTIVYTITDKDGDTATAILTITINGQDEPKVDVPPADTTPVNTVPATNPTFDPTSPNKPKDAGNPDASGDNKTVFEGDGPSEGKFTVTTDKDATITSITVGDKEIPVENGTISTTTVDTGKGTLVVTGFNPENGEVTYTYDPEPQDHATDEPIVDKVPVSVKDSNQNTATSEINIAITDGLPAANDDANTISEGGETVSGSLKANDDFGADGQPSPTTGYTPVTDAAGQYGKFTIDEEGNYSYTLDNANPAVNALANGQTLTDSITYTITDADGDTATAVLTITIEGDTDTMLNPDYKRGIEDNTLTVNSANGVLANDTDLKGQTIASASFNDNGVQNITLGVATAITKAGKEVGKLTLNADGSYTFVPEKDWSGALPEITYAVGDKTTTLQIDIVPQVEDGINITTTEITPPSADKYLSSGVEGMLSTVVVGTKDLARTHTANINAQAPANTGAMAKRLDDFIAAGVDDAGNPITTKNIDALTSKIYFGTFVDVNGGPASTLPDGLKESRGLPSNQIATADFTSEITEGTVTGTGRLIETWVHLKAGDKVSFKGFVDDGVKIELAGKDLVWGTGNNSWGHFDSTNTEIHGDARALNSRQTRGAGEVEIEKDGYYSLRIYHYNGTNTGSFDVVMSTNGKDYLPITTEHFDLYAKMSDVTSPYVDELKTDMRDNQTATADSDDKEGYYLVHNNDGMVNKPVKLAEITINKGAEDTSDSINTGGKESVVSTELVGLPNGTQITDGEKTVAVTNGRVNVTDLNLSNLSLIGANVAGIYNTKIVHTVHDQTQLSQQGTSADDAPEGKDVVTDDNSKVATHTKVIEKDFTITIRPQVSIDVARVSEEGLANGKTDDLPTLFDKTDKAVETGVIKVMGAANPNAVTVALDLPTQGLTSNQQAVSWSSNADKTVWTATRTDGTKVLEIKVGEKSITGNDVSFTYTSTLLAPLDHADTFVEDNLGVNFGVVVKNGTEELLKEKHIITVVEDDMPAHDAVVHNIQVAHDRITLSSLEGGFTETLFTTPNPNYTGWVVGGGNVLNPRLFENDVDYRIITTISNGYSGVGVANKSELADGDNMDDALFWGRTPNAQRNPDGTAEYKPEDSRQPGYILVDNPELKGTNTKELDSLNTPFILGTFSHDNWGSISDGGALSFTHITSRFKVNINGVQVQVPDVKFPLTHLETGNGYQPVNPYSDDVIIVKQADSYVQVGSTTYRLKIDDIRNTSSTDAAMEKVRAARTLVAGLNYSAYDAQTNPNGSPVGHAINNTLSKDRLLTYIGEWDLDGNGVIEGAETTANFRQALEAWTNSMKEVEERIKAENPQLAYKHGVAIQQQMYDLAELQRLINVAYVEAGKAAELEKIFEEFELLMFSSVENQSNRFELTAHLEPVTDPTKLQTSVTVLDKVHFGSDKPDNTNVIWGGAAIGTELVREIKYFDAQGNELPEAEKDKAEITRITSDYGVFIGNKDGGYSFTGAENLPTVVGENQTGKFEYTYTYVDDDGDTVTSTVTFNFTGLTTAQMASNAGRTFTDTSENGVNDYFVGSSEAETISGGKGADTLIGNAGRDTLLGGDDNDVLFYDKNDVLIDGGAGDDTLSLQAWSEFQLNGQTGQFDILAIDFSTAANVANVKNIERIDMTNDQAQTLKLSASAVLEMTDSRNTLFITGDGGAGKNADKFELTGLTKATSDQAGYQLYTGTVGSDTVKVYFENDLTQII